MNLMPNENVLFESPGKTLFLTTHRVRYQAEGFGGGEIRSIMLEELASCAMVRTSNPILLVLAGVCFLIGLVIAANREPASLIGGIILAGILVAIWAATRQQVLALASAGTTIRVSTMGMKAEVVKQFIEQTEAAKNARYLLGRGI
jgi:hypothetical protein